MIARIPGAPSWRRFPRAAVIAVLVLAAGCVEEPKQAPDPAVRAFAATPSASGIYDCAEDGRIQVEFAGSGVRITESDGTIVELPAAPPGQMTRFGEGASAIVIEGREALYMRGRREPWTCIR